MNLNSFNSSSFKRGRTLFVEMLWLLMQAIVVNSCQPSSRLRILVLRLFGANIGLGVIIKPHVRVKFPWKLVVGDYSWIGEGVWIDNLAEVDIGSHCCISQGVYLCTGSHDWGSQSFDLVVQSIVIQDKVWICAKSVVGPNTLVGEGSVLTLGAIAIGHYAKWAVFSGNPAREVKKRSIRSSADRL